MKEISLRPYNGRLFYCTSKEDYKRANKKLMIEPDILPENAYGRFYAEEGTDGQWTYIVWAETTHAIAHEIAHVVLHVFDRVGITVTSGHDEPFCYMLGQLILDCEDAK